jgi:hypothetical protein
MPTRTNTTTQAKPVIKASRRFFFAIGFTEEIVEGVSANSAESEPPPPGLPFAGSAIAQLPAGPGLRKAPGNIVQLFQPKRVASR